MKSFFGTPTKRTKTNWGIYIIIHSQILKLKNPCNSIGIELLLDLLEISRDLKFNYMQVSQWKECFQTLTVTDLGINNIIQYNVLDLCFMQICFCESSY